MSLSSSLFAGVSGLNAQGSVLSIIGDNIANVSTTGFKGGSATFSSLVTGTGASGGSGSIQRNRLQVDQQGQIQATGISTDIAIDGQGFFVVKDQPALDDGRYLYTRAGSFRQDEQGNFVNSAGFYLQAYPLDNEGRLPGATGNQNTTSAQLLESLVTVNTRDISGLAFATTGIKLGLNLDASEEALLGSGDTGKPALGTPNYQAAADDILVPYDPDGAGPRNFQVGATLDITLAGAATPITVTYGGFGQSYDVSGGIYGVTDAISVFNGAGIANGDTLIVSVAGGNSYTFTFNSTNPSAANGTFNSLQTLADAIDSKGELSARVYNDVLYYGTTDPSIAITTADGVGNTATFTAAGPAGLGMASVAGALDTFNSMQSLVDILNTKTGLIAAVDSPANDSSIRINTLDSLSTIAFNHDGVLGTFITEFGFPATTLAGGPGTALNPVYDAAALIGDNMASGEISPAFSRNIRIFDSLGVGHDVRVSFAKRANNEWLVEVYAAKPEEIVEATPNSGLLASGTILFNGDGSLRNVSTSLSNPINIVWQDDSQPSAITIDFGTAGLPAGTVGAASIGLTDGLSQFDGPYTVQFSEQNGASSGLLSSIEIDKDGFIIANFSNGQSRNVFRIPMATFPNPNGLKPEAGNVYSQAEASGEFSLNLAGSAGVGIIATQALENANVELADELTRLIIAQRAFQSNTKVITTADQLLEELNRI